MLICLLTTDQSFTMSLYKFPIENIYNHHHGLQNKHNWFRTVQYILNCSYRICRRGIFLGARCDAQNQPAIKKWEWKIENQNKMYGMASHTKNSLFCYIRKLLSTVLEVSPSMDLKVHQKINTKENMIFYLRKQ